MPSPQYYFNDSRERELAELVWALALDRQRKGAPFLSGVHSALQHTAYLPAAKQIVYARDWMTVNRGDGEAAGVVAVNSAFGKPAREPNFYFGYDACANVEHFYSAAMIAITLGPTVTTAGSVVWDGILDSPVKTPLAAAMDAFNNPPAGRTALGAFFAALPAGFISGIGRLPSNWSQMIGPNQMGIAFALSQVPSADPVAPLIQSQSEALRLIHAGVHKIRQVLDAPLPPRPPVAPPGVQPPSPNPVLPLAPPSDFEAPFPVKSAGLMLSDVSLKFFGHFKHWVTIYHDNLDLLKDGPNKVPHGPNVNLRIRKKSKITQADESRAAKNYQNWKTYRV